MKTDFERTGKLYRKINIYRRKRGRVVWYDYICSTNQWRTCRDAKAAWLAANPDYDAKHIKVTFA